MLQLNVCRIGADGCLIHEQRIDQSKDAPLEAPAKDQRNTI